MTIRRQAQQGFTLIEVLIAMTLLSIMVVLLFTSLKICAQSWEQGESKITEVNEVAVVYNFFQQHLAASKPVWNDFSGEEGVKTFAFQGARQTLQFVTAFPDSVGRKGLQQFSLSLQQQDGDSVIKVGLSPFLPLAEGEQWHQDEVVLVKHVTRFELSYFGAEPGNDDIRWQTEWVEKEIQPQLVKVSIELDNSIDWPDLIIDLKVTGNYSNEDNDGEVVDETKEVDPNQQAERNR